MASGRTTVIDDYAELEDAVAEVGRGVFLSVIGSPLWSQGEIVGVLEAGLKTDRKLKDEDVEAFELLAYKAGRALENARAFDEQRQTVERLGELDRLKDDFIATVSHELRTPLTVIEGMGTALETQWDDLDEAQALHLLSRINANAKALHRIIISLLDFSRVRGGHLELQPEEMDIGEFVKDLASRLGSLFIDRPLSVEVERGLVVDVDEALIDRVCENLMGNAAKHTPPGTKVVVSCRRDGDEVEFAVADDGPGIPASEIGHLTERFFRGTKVRSTRGLGLGLSLVEEILYMHGSQLVVESTEGEGARFSFRLPLKTRDLSSKGEEHSEKPEQTR
jgi:K+-sensing histidine kinase KdpD